MGLDWDSFNLEELLSLKVYELLQQKYFKYKTLRVKELDNLCHQKWSIVLKVFKFEA
jgi:hypothetical protein